eukprot:3647247-Karenia_brevis.AAC.1
MSLLPSVCQPGTAPSEGVCGRVDQETSLKLICRSIRPCSHSEAIACLEREQFPLVGPSIDRRTVELVTQVYNDTA